MSVAQAVRDELCADVWGLGIFQIHKYEQYKYWCLA